MTALHNILLSALLLAGSGSALAAEETNAPSATASTPPIPPKLEREFRGVWVATVKNIDWPSAPGLPEEQQRKELREILQQSKQLHLNAVVLQVRPACDAFYASDLEPWSEYLNGEIGKEPEAYYDPLEFAIEEAHKLGLELHAWINPYRAGFVSSPSVASSRHISKTHPEFVVTYGKHLWLDPGKPKVQDYVTDIVTDIVKRYDVDGIHLDDYFYPYPEKNEDGTTIPFPDENTFMEYVADGGENALEDWRRENVNQLIARFYQTIKAQKPWVKFGVSPFGIWQPGFPPTVRGMNSFTQIYCDSLKWLTNGTVDYLAPQLYWKINATEQSYPELLRWWAEHNVQGRHLWPGNFTSRVSAEPDETAKRWDSAEIIHQIQATRNQAGAGGNIHFSMKTLLLNRGKINDALREKVYREPALIPASPWLKNTVLAPPTVSLKHEAAGAKLTWAAADNASVWQWVLQKRVAGQWQTEIHPAITTTCLLAKADAAKWPDVVAVYALDRYGAASQPSVLENQP